METQLFRLFLDLIKTGSFSDTAKKHFRTQPAVSIAIRRLENELGIKLLEPQRRKIKLTLEGENLKDRMAHILQLVDDLKFEASLATRYPRGRVTIATIHSVGLYELTDPIKLFVKKFRDIQLDIRYDLSKRIYDLVENREVDLGIVAYPQQTPEIEVVLMVENEMVIITSPGDELGRSSQVPLEKLAGRDFVAFSDKTPTRHAIDQALNHANVRVEMRFENENIETMKKAVEVGIGISIVPIKSIERERQSGQLKVVRIKGQFLKRPIGIIKSRKYPLNQAAAFFMKELFNKPASRQRVAVKPRSRKKS